MTPSADDADVTVRLALFEETTINRTARYVEPQARVAELIAAAETAEKEHAGLTLALADAKTAHAQQMGDIEHSHAQQLGAIEHSLAATRDGGDAQLAASHARVRGTVLMYLQT